MKNKVSFTYKIDKNTKLLKLVKDSEIKIKMPCKKGKCGKCLIKIEGDLNNPTKNELKLLSSEQIKEGYRLACEVEILGDANIKMKL